MRAVLADAGPLYAAVDPEDTHHERARRELKLLTGERRDVVVVYPALLEAYTLIPEVGFPRILRLPGRS